MSVKEKIDNINNEVWEFACNSRYTVSNLCLTLMLFEQVKANSDITEEFNDGFVELSVGDKIHVPALIYKKKHGLMYEKTV